MDPRPSRRSSRSGQSLIRFRQTAHPGRGALVAAGYIYDKQPPLEVYGRLFPDYALVYLLEGGGIYEDERIGKVPVRQGDLLVIFPGFKHSYYRGDQPKWSECFLVFQGRIFQQLEADGLIDRQRPVLSPGLVAELVSAFDRLIRDYRQPQLHSEALFAARIHLLLAQISHRHELAAKSRRDTDFVAQACALLEERLDERRSCAWVARTLRLSHENFRKRFVREVGMPPARYRVLRRIDLAKTLLAEEGLRAVVVAERLGYCDPYFFCRQFKHVTGQTPARFRAHFHHAAAVPAVVARKE